MIIRKTNSTTLAVESSQNKVSVTLKSLDGQIIIKISNGSDIEIIKPGDYEYMGVGITAFEIPSDKFLANINLVKINIDGVRTLFITKSTEIPKDILNNLANIDILVIPLYGVNEAKSIINAIEPKKVVFLKSFEGSTEIEIESLKKTLGLQTLEEVSSVKHKSGDFDSLGEDYILTGEILS